MSEMWSQRKGDGWARGAPQKAAAEGSPRGGAAAQATL